MELFFQPTSSERSSNERHPVFVIDVDPKEYQKYSSSKSDESDAFNVWSITNTKKPFIIRSGSKQGMLETASRQELEDAFGSDVTNEEAVLMILKNGVPHNEDILSKFEQKFATRERE